MALINVLAEAIRPERLGAFEENVRKIAEAAASARDPLRWATHQTLLGEIGWFFFVAPARDFAEIQRLGTPEEMARRVLGEKEGRRALEVGRECIASARQTVAVERRDLSYPPQPSGSPAPLHLVTVVRARPGGQEAVEEILRKISEAIPKVDDPARTTVYQTLIGDLREYRVVRPLRTLEDLDHQLQPVDLLDKAFGSAEGGLIFRTGQEAIEHLERRIVAYRPELSNRPA
jgi:hypothetical protein